MNYWDTNEKFPYQRPVSWDDIKIVADFEKIPLMQARDYMKRLGHPVPVGDPPSHLTNPGDKLWPGRKR